MRVFRQLDLFRVVQDSDKHLTPATRHGATVTLLMLLALALLLLSEVLNYMKGYQQCTVAPRAMLHPMQNRSLSEAARLHTYIVFPYIPCHRLTAIIHTSGTPLAALSAQIVLTRYHVPRGSFRPDVRHLFDPHGPISEGSAAAALPGALAGCYVEATAPLADVPASFNIVVDKYNATTDQALRSDHYIRQLYAGERDLAGLMTHITSATTRPLRDLTRNVTDLRGHARYIYQYYLQFIETAVDTVQESIEDYQYTESWSTVFHANPHLPAGVYISYRHSTFSVVCSEHHATPSHFVVHLCAVIGGIYVVTGFIEELLERTLRHRQRRAQAAQHAENTVRALQETG